MEIENATAFVTGANRGIGRAFVEELLDAGAAKIYATSRNPDSLTDLVASAPERIVPVTLDVTKPETVRTASENYRDVTILVNNAGIAEYAALIGAENIDAARAEMETNYFGTLNMIRAFSPVLRVNGGGAIVNLASVASLANFPLLGSYSASKAATHSLTQGIRAELAAQGTQVFGVYPGPIDTDMAAQFIGDKTPPREVVKTIIKGVEAGEDDIYPDPMSLEFHEGLLNDPKAIEQQAGEMMPE
jgi:NAD(P)-dependent dehydrogenase (short-subunit alcohol dehydrogenase family)